MPCSLHSACRQRLKLTDGRAAAVTAAEGHDWCHASLDLDLPLPLQVFYHPTVHMVLAVPAKVLDILSSTRSCQHVCRVCTPVLLLAVGGFSYKVHVWVDKARDAVRIDFRDGVDKTYFIGVSERES